MAVNCYILLLHLVHKEVHHIKFQLYRHQLLYPQLRHPQCQAAVSSSGSLLSPTRSPSASSQPDAGVFHVNVNITSTITSFTQTSKGNWLKNNENPSSNMSIMCEMRDYWSTLSFTNAPWFRSIFTRGRFEQILTFVHLVNNENTPPRESPKYKL